MPGAKPLFQTLIIILQACFAGVLLGQMVHLMTDKELFTSLGVLLVFAGGGLIVALTFFKKPIQRHIFSTGSFVWIHFTSVIIYGIILLLHLLPVLFDFEESALIIYIYQLSSLIALVFIVAENYLLHLNLLQNVYDDLLRGVRRNVRLRHLVWVLSLGSATILSIFFHQLFAGSLSQVVGHTLISGTGLFVLLVGVKIRVFKRLNSPALYRTKDDAQGEEKIQEKLKGYGNYYYIGENLAKVLLASGTENRPLICNIIRQIPLIEKIEELESIQKEYLPHDKDLAYTIQFLGKLAARLADKEAGYDIDQLSSIPEIKACIRMSIVDGSPMLVQKLLNDNRPEVKKAAILATVFFNEASLMPALVGLLKDHEFAFSAKEALYKFGDQCLPFLRSAKYRNKDNSFFIEQCLDLVQSYRSNEARDFLIEMLNEPQKRFRYKAAKALLENNYTLSGLHKTQMLHFVESLIATIAVEREIRCNIEKSGEVGDDQLLEALLEEEREKRTLVFDLLAAFVAKPILAKIKENVKKEPGKYRYPAFALIDLFFPLTLRNKCKILIGSSRNENIAPRLQMEYLNEQIWFNYASREEAVKQILKMDYGQIGYWLRACALKRLASMPHQQVSLLILAEVFNNNQLLQEVAFEVLYQLNYDYYILQTQRLPPDRVKVIKQKIENDELLKGYPAKVEDRLLFHQVLSLRSFSLLKEFSYENLARKIMLFSLISFDDTKRKINFDPYRRSGYWLVCEGGFTISHWGEEVLKAAEGDIIDTSFLVEAEPDSLILDPVNKINIYFIEYYTFNKLYSKLVYPEKQILQPSLIPSAKLAVA